MDRAIVITIVMTSASSLYNYFYGRSTTLRKAITTCLKAIGLILMVTLLIAALLMIIWEFITVHRPGQKIDATYWYILFFPVFESAAGNLHVERSLPGDHFGHATIRVGNGDDYLNTTSGSFLQRCRDMQDAVFPDQKHRIQYNTIQCLPRQPYPKIQTCQRIALCLHLTLPLPFSSRPLSFSPIVTASSPQQSHPGTHFAASPLQPRQHQSESYWVQAPHRYLSVDS
ncbi:hypothetical protein ES702_02596 [subsurface metagenome]